MTSPEDEKLDELRRTVEELEERLEDRQQKFRLLTSVTNEVVVTVENGIQTYVSPQYEALFGWSREEVLGKSPTEFMAIESRETLAEDIQARREGARNRVGLRKDGTRFLMDARSRELHYDGRTVRVTTITDITERERAEAAERTAAVTEETIRLQAEMIAKLSTPLLPISDGVVVLPLVGEVNAARAAQVVETITHGVAAHGAAIAILDITGTLTVDSQVADMLVRAAEAVHLLGARMILTGISAAAAEALVELGKDLRRIVTFGTLMQGVAYALRETLS